MANTFTHKSKYTFTDVKFQSITETEQTLTELYFTKCKFQDCNFMQSAFEHCIFTDCEFVQCNLTAVKVEGTAFITTMFVNCKVLGVNWTRTSKLGRSMGFTRSVINYCDFVGLSLPKLKLNNCVAQEVNFTDADLNGADCRMTDFKDSTFANTNLMNADLSGAFDYKIDPTKNRLTKAKFSMPAAIALLTTLDIVLVEPPLDQFS